jgi:hypothetical protein
VARFRAFVRGYKGAKVSRLGDEVSGVYAELTAADVGITIVGRVSDGQDGFDVWVTSGREKIMAPHGDLEPTKFFVGRVEKKNAKPVWIPVGGGMVR